ncbi:MAG: hypothetical protein IJV66_06030, partial [Firmicutes bacterium]|nr:hypothetical protein [Bacillota bacterium]
KDDGKSLVYQQVFANDYMDKVRETLDIENETYENFMLAEDSLTYFFTGKDEETGRDVITPVKLLP